MIVKFESNSLFKKRFRFKDSFDEFSLLDITRFMSLCDKIDDKSKEIRGLSKYYSECIDLINEGFEDAAQQLQYETEMKEFSLSVEMTLLKLDLLSVFCYKPKQFKKYTEYKDGITKGIIDDLLEQCIDKFGDFTDYWNNVQCVEGFKHRGKWQLLGTSYKVHEMDKTTLMREVMAHYESSMAFTEKALLDSGKWEHICKFVATLVRPSKQVNEISHTRNSFVNSYKVRGFDHSAKSEYYKQELEKSIEKRQNHFENLPLYIAIGVLKEYFKKKSEVATKWKISTGKKTEQTKQSENYANTFGIEKTIESLVDVSNYTNDEIWLFSVEVFYKELKKFDMKIDAINKEMEAEYKKLGLNT